MPSLPRSPRWNRALVAPLTAMATTFAPSPARAHPEPIEVLPEIEVVVGRSEDLKGEVQAASTGRIGPQEVMSRPTLRPGEILEHVPGVTVTQHSGSGKANQFFLRGFNLDHGTDFATYVDGAPLNMPTHGHGQGYMDTNFLIPELVASMDFRKGPYHADAGDFASAGSVKIRMKDELDEGFAKVETGADGWQRYLVADSTTNDSGTFLYAVEANGYDGPWDQDEDLERFNLHLRWTNGNEDHGNRLTFWTYGSSWTSTDQVPRRAVLGGQISALGTLDPTTGGSTRRTGITGEHWSPSGNGSLRLSYYAMRYELDLFSNFTYFLDDPVNGDQFNQVDDRLLWGLSLTRDWESDLGRRAVRHRTGVRLRRDDIRDVALHQTRARARIGTVRQDAVDQRSFGVFYEGEVDWTDRLRGTVGVRAHRYLFDVDARTLPQNSGTREAGIGNYNVGLAYRASDRSELYLNHGTGFHSNDARGTTIRIDPGTLQAVNAVDPLVRSRGSEVGVRTGFSPRHRATFAVWTLDLDSELVFVGDAGTTEASRPSRRHGIEWNNHVKLSPVFTLHADYSWTNAYFRDQDPAGNEIPQAVESTLGAGLAFQLEESGVFGGLHVRSFQSAPLIEDGSQRSESTTVVNAQVGKRRGDWSWQLDVLNLFDSRDADITYFFDSRLPGEAAGGVSDIHSHPVVPRSVRVSFTRKF